MSDRWRTTRMALLGAVALVLSACGTSAEDSGPEDAATSAVESVTTVTAEATTTSEVQEPSTTTAAPTTVTTEAPTTTPPALASPNNLEVISAGEEPRFEIRFAPEAGDVFESTLFQSQNLRTSVDGEPDTEVTVVSEVDSRFEVTASDSSGFTMVTTFEDIRVDRERTIPADAAGQIEAGLLGLLEVSIESSFTPLGEIVSVKSLVESSDPAIQALADQQIESSKSINIAVPTVSLGVGAMWKVSDEIVAGGLPATIEFTSTVTEINADGASTDIVVTSTFESGEHIVEGALFEVVDGSFSNGQGSTTYLRWSPTTEFDLVSNSEVTLLVGPEKARIFQSVSGSQTQAFS